MFLILFYSTAHSLNFEILLKHFYNVIDFKIILKRFRDDFEIVLLYKIFLKAFKSVLKTFQNFKNILKSRGGHLRIKFLHIVLFQYLFMHFFAMYLFYANANTPRRPKIRESETKLIKV